MITVGSDGKLSIVAAGEATITASQAANGNYAATSTTFTVTVNPNGISANGTGTGDGINGQIVLGGVPEGGFTYDGNSHTPTITVKDGNGNTIPEGEYTVSYKDSQGNPVNAPTNAGTYTVVVNDNTGGNYTVSGETTFTVKQATLAITAKGQTVTFGTDIATGTDQVTVSGLQGSDALSEIKLTQSTKDVSTNGTITPSQAVIKNGTTDVTTNYSITFKDGQLTITSKSVNADGSPKATGTIELSQESFTYDKQPHKPTVTVKDASGNVIPAEQYNVIYKDSKGQPVTDPTEADTYTVVITDKTGTGFDNYTVTGETTFTINAADATLAFANVTKTFGDAAFTVTPTTDDSKGAITFTSGNTNVITVGSDGKLSIVAAGEATITASQAANGNYAATSTTFTVTVNPNGISANGTGTGDGINGQIVLGGVPEGGFTYDGNTHKPTVTVKDGNGNVVPADQYTVMYKDSKGNPVNAPTDADTYTVEIIDKTGTGFDNYTVSGETTFTVKQATLAITAKGQTVTFGTDIATGTDQVTVSGLQGSDALSEIKLTQSTKDVSTNGTITPSQAVIKNGTTDVTTNYSITFKDGQLTITSKSVNADGSPKATGTIELSQESFTYDKQPHKPTVTVKDASGNVIPAEQYNVIYKDSKGQPVTDPTEADTYTVVITDKTGTGFDNYTVTGETTFTINAADATLAFANVTKTFGDAAFTVTPTADDNKGAITFTSSNTSVITVSGNQLSIVGAGEAIITASQAANGSYNATSTTFTVTVKPKTLTITADAKTKIIGDEDPILTYTSKGLVGTDKISGTLTRDEGEDPGTYAIRQGSLSAGKNYSISYTGANLTIKPEVISITAKNDWFTFSNNRDVTLPDGLTVNTCLLDPTGTKAMYYVVSDDQLTVNGQRVLKGGNGVLLHGKAGTTYEFTVIGTTKVSGNAKSYGATQLIPVIEETHFEKGQIFVLSSNKFVPILDTNTKVPARRAVLWLASGTTAARELTLVDSGTTGITTANSTDATDAWYTLDGRKLDEKPTKKGLYILNGRKVVIR